MQSLWIDIPNDHLWKGPTNPIATASPPGQFGGALISDHVASDHASKKRQSVFLVALDWLGSVGGAIGALLLALNVSWSGWAYPILLLFTGILLLVAVLRRRWPYTTLFTAFTAINLIGIYRWLLA